MGEHWFQGPCLNQNLFKTQGLVLGIPGVVLPAKHLSQEQHRCDLFRWRQSTQQGGCLLLLVVGGWDHLWTVTVLGDKYQVVKVLEMAPPTVKGFSCVFCWESAFIAKNLVYESLHLSQIHLFGFQWMVGKIGSTTSRQWLTHFVLLTLQSFWQNTPFERLMCS